MSRVPWSLLEKDAVEQLVSILLCSENPDALRVRASIGDGGIDVLVPKSGKKRHIDVYQVKYFNRNLTSGQKTQIKKSIERINIYAQANGYTIDNWYLTLPLDPTKENLDWFDELVEGYSFTSQWRGLEFFEGLAAKYPAVVDYYAHNGSGRLNGAVLALTNALRMQQAITAQVGVRPAKDIDPGVTATVLQPEDVRAGLAGLHAELNRHDPHYRYSFAVDHDPPHLSDEPYLMAAVQDIRPDQCITFKIYARFVEAAIERPVPGMFQIKAERGSKLWQDLELFHKFGRPFEAPLGSASFAFDLPGGLGGEFEGASVVVGEVGGQAVAYEIRLEILDESGGRLSEAHMRMGPPTRGADGTGVRAHGVEAEGVFSFEILTDLESQQAEMSFTPNNIAGKRPSVVLEGLTFLAHLRPPHQLNVRQAFGPDLGQPMAISEGAGDLRANLARLELVEALSVVQDFTPTQVFIPDDSVLTPALAIEILRASRILREETLIDRWKDVKVCLDTGASVAAKDRFAVRLVERLRLQLGDEYVVGIPSGARVTDLPRARMDLDRNIIDHDDHKDVVLVPVDDSPATVRFVTNSELLAAIPEHQNGRVWVKRESRHDGEAPEVP